MLNAELQLCDNDQDERESRERREECGPVVSVRRMTCSSAVVVTHYMHSTAGQDGANGHCGLILGIFPQFLPQSSSSHSDEGTLPAS